MASNRVDALFLISIILAATNPLAHGVGVTLQGLSVTGRLCCTPTGNCPGLGISGTNVSLNCSILGVSTVIGKGTTNASGTFNITIPAVTGLILGLPIVPCVASVQLPLGNVVCPVLSNTTGVLVSAIQSVGTVFTSVLGLVQNAIITGFINLTL